MADKNVLVTGASGGLGIPVVRKLLDDGWHVYACIHQKENIPRMENIFSHEKDHRLHLIVADIENVNEVKKIAAAAQPWHAVVHLAGGFKAAHGFADHTVEDFDRMFDLNTKSTFLLFHVFLPAMKKNGQGSMVTIGAKGALHPSIENAAYTASKAALISLTLQAAEEGRQVGVRANVIAPAMIRTATNERWASSEQEMQQWTPPQDIAEIVGWLISDSAMAITGTIIPMYHHLEP